MGDFNMPPGVSVNDIPGNRPEDVEIEEFFEALDKEFIKQYGDNGKKWLTMLEDIDPEDMIWEYIEVARSLAFDYGYNKGQVDTYMEVSSREMDKEEKHTYTIREGKTVCVYCGKEMEL
jgi:hypothetical protein